jgi:ABC-type antimicrobial peptide transport system permease subunit
MRLRILMAAITNPKDENKPITAGTETVNEEGEIRRRTRDIFQLEHINLLRESSNIQDAYIAEPVGYNYGLVHNGETYRLQGLVQATSEYMRAAGIELIEGSYFAGTDELQGNRVIVISESVAKQLFPNQSALGKQVHITAGTMQRALSQRSRSQQNTMPFDVVGVFRDMDKLQSTFVEFSHAVIPLGSHQQVRVGGASQGSMSSGPVAAAPIAAAPVGASSFAAPLTAAPAPALTMPSAEAAPPPVTIQRVGAAVGQRYREIVIEAVPGRLHAAADDVRVIMYPFLNQGDEIFVDYVKDRDEQLFSTANRVITFFGGFGFIALFISAVGIMSLMLVTVVERTRDIGLRRALGASKRWIWAQFMGETLVITAVGCLLGFIAAALSARYVLEELLLQAFWSDLVPFSGRLTLPSVAFSFCIALVLGLLAGILPAREAANLAPMEALREG